MSWQKWNNQQWGGAEKGSGPARLKPDGPKHPPSAPPKSMKANWQNAVKQEIGAKPDEPDTDRQAKIRARMERIRAEARGEVPVQPDTKPQKRPAPAAAAATVTTAAFEPAQKKQKGPSADEMRREDDDSRKVDQLLPPLEDKVTKAEEEAERVAILAAPLAMEPTPELKDLQLTAVRETERAVKAAIGSVATARREIEKKKQETQAFAPIARESAAKECNKLLERIDAVQVKLDEHKSARKDHEVSINAEKLFGELSQRLAGIEMDCEKAAMMAEPLSKALDSNPQDISAAEIREAKEALKMAQATLAPTSRLIVGKVAGLKGAVRTKMLDLQSRAEAAQSLLDKAHKIADEAQSRAAAGPILKQTAERLAKVEEVLLEMRESEGPFLMGIETLPGDEGSELLVKMDKAAAVAQSAIADAHKYVSLKLVEVGRLAEGAAEAARAEMERAKQQLNEGLERVRQFQTETSKRKRANLVEVVRGRVEVAESLLQQLKEAGEALKCADASEMKELLDKGRAIEIEAAGAVTAARRELQDRQQEMRPVDGVQTESLKNSSEILRTKVRVNYMEAEITKFKQVAKEIEEKMKIDKALTPISNGLRAAEEEIDPLVEMSSTWSSDDRVPQEDEKKIAAAQSKLTSITNQVEKKLGNAQGVELKELRGIFSRLKAAQAKLDKAKEIARNLNKAEATKAVKEVQDALHKAESKAGQVAAMAPAPASLGPSKLEEIHQEANAAVELVAEVQKLIAAAQGPGMMLEAKVEFARLQLRCKQVDRKAKNTLESLSSALKKMTATTTDTLVCALRDLAKQTDGSYDVSGLFMDVSEGSGEVTAAQTAAFVTRRKPDLNQEKILFAFRRLAPHGLGQRSFAGMLARFMKVLKDVSLTDVQDIHGAKKVRKLDIGELIEVLGDAQEDAGGLCLSRAQCRAVRDNATGWVTLKAGATGIYLEPVSKPLMWCKSVTTLAKDDIGGNKVRDVKPGEVLELLEGPKDERVGSDLRVRGIACHEDSAGWLQVMDKTGKSLAILNKNIHKCTEAIAMTDSSDLEKCKQIRRIDAGEALEALPDKTVETEGTTRMMFRACRDDVRGWVTVKGNRGTQYTRPVPKHYICQQPTPVHSGLGAETAVVRVLMAGEAFAAFEEPKEVVGGDSRTHYRVRASTDGSEGWVSSTADAEIQTWSSQYMALRAVALTRNLAANEAAEAIEVVRCLEVNEIIEVSEPPVEDKSTGQLRVRCAAKDGASGWATVREGASVTSPLLLRPATADETKPKRKKAQTDHSDFTSAAVKRPFPEVKQEVEDRPAKLSKGGGKGNRY